MALSTSLIAAALLSPIYAQFVTPPTNLTTKEGHVGISVRYKVVPSGICETTPGVKSYSGYADVAEDEHLFWWFHEARNQDPSTAPLTVWIDGGPGFSSMSSMFLEMGPCKVDYNGDVHFNPYSWTNVTNMIFIDQPVQVGFSYSIPVPGYIDSNANDIVAFPDNSCPDDDTVADSCGTYSYPNITLTSNSTWNAAPNLWKALQGFAGAFPQYAKNGFILMSESYGGHYAPVFAEYFEQQSSKNITNALDISFKAVGIGNGWYDPTLQTISYYNYTVDPGNSYDFNPLNESASDELYNYIFGPGNCLDRIADCRDNPSDMGCATGDNFCDEIGEFLADCANRDKNDIRELESDPFPDDAHISYLNRPEVQAAIGAYVNYTDESKVVGDAFAVTGDDSREAGTIQATRDSLARGVSVTHYYGDADYECNWMGGEAVADEINAPGFSDAGFVNITTPDGIVHGQVKQAGHYSFVRVYEAGHVVGWYQPAVQFAIFERNMKGLDIATGTINVTADYKTVGSARSDYHQGNATIQFDDVDDSCKYNHITNVPDCENSTSNVRLLL